MRWPRHKVRLIHRWLMLAVGVQFLIWVASGVYFALVDIHYIHGESEIISDNRPVAADLVQIDFTELQQDYPHAREIRLGSVMGTPVYRFSDSEQKQMVNATTGERFLAMTETQARQLARYHYTGTARPAQVTLLTDTGPAELSSRHLPVWQVQFDDSFNTTLYLSPVQQEVVTVRHTAWRAFEWFWRFHIMDYLEGSDPQNGLLFWITLAGIIAAIMGLNLTWLRFFTRKEPS